MDLNEILRQIDALKAEIDALRPIDPAQEQRIMQKFRLDWTYHSNAIEGNTLTFGETKAFLLHGVTAQGKPFRDYLDIKGHHAALDYLLDIVQQQEPLTEAAVRELHKIILVEAYETNAVTQDGRFTKRRIIPGQYKSMPNHVRTSTGEVYYYASPEETSAKMADLIAWYRRDLDKNELHPFILAATFHYQFVIIHPFDDGNGRMARLLMNLLLMQAGFPPVIIPLDSKNEYLLALEQADADNDLEPFTTLIGQSLVKSLTLFVQGAKGEPIEKLDDLDKKIALLDKKIEAKKLRRERSLESVHSLTQNLFIPLLISLFEKFTKLNRYFLLGDGLISIFSFSSEEPTQLDLTKNKFSQTINNIYSIITIENGNIHSIAFSYKWMVFKTDESFNLNFEMVIYLKPFEYILVYDIGDSAKETQLLTGYYDQVFSDKRLESIVVNLVNHVIQLIDHKVAD